jgi:8-oxo-dGTP pyrophosphatase MutT (NUDIX family)
MRQLITDCFAGTAIPDDVAAVAEAQVDPEVLAAWFKMPLRPAAVLLALTERNGELHMLLTERTHTVRDHPGQVAFPGGVAEDHDRDLQQTALRESDEEIGLRPDQVEVAGYLPGQPIITGYAVLPVVGFFDPGFIARTDPREVAGVFQVPLNFLLDPANKQAMRREKDGVVLDMYEFNYDGHRIWGATALMIGQFIAVLNKTQDNPLRTSPGRT